MSFKPILIFYLAFKITPNYGKIYTITLFNYDIYLLWDDPSS